MAKKKRQSKSARALKRRIARLEEQVSAFGAGGADAGKACDSAVTREAYHQIKERASIRLAVIRGVRRAVSMLK